MMHRSRVRNLPTAGDRIVAHAGHLDSDAPFQQTVVRDYSLRKFTARHVDVLFCGMRILGRQQKQKTDK
jgi:hypothetical protein